MLFPQDSKILDLLCMDSFRMPVCLHENVQYEWMFVCTCFISKQVFCGEVEQNNTLSRRVVRPQSTQTLEIFEKFSKYLRETTGDSDIHPRQIVCDNGPEFLGKFQTRFAI